MKSNPDITYRLGILIEANRIAISETSDRIAIRVGHRENQAFRRQMQEA